MVNKLKRPELLAPAGDLERLKIALLYGADAVYVGGNSFSLRANAINFSIEELEEAVSFAHNLNKKIYVTVNIALHDEESTTIINYLKELDRIMVDAIIVSDPFIIELAKKYTSLEIHLSTQQSTLNYEAVEYFKNEGVTRVVLAREVTSDDIKLIKDKVDIELECFIHGAMCASYSGRCVLSNFLTARDSNRGGCSQICRWDFALLNENLENIKGEKDFTFCTKDLSLLKHIPDLINLGVDSFKIEGRMRSVYYVATVVNIYRRVIDEYLSCPSNYQVNVEYEKILRNCANRDSIVQFFDGNYGLNCQYYNGRVEVSNQDFLGIILDYDEEKHLATIEQRNYFKKGDIVEVFGPNISTSTLTISDIYDENNNLIDVVRHPKQVVKVRICCKVYKNDMMRIKR